LAAGSWIVNSLSEKRISYDREGGGKGEAYGGSEVKEVRDWFIWKKA